MRDQQRTEFLVWVAVSLAAMVSVDAAEEARGARFIPRWSKGDWWDVASDYVVSRENNPDLPPALVSASAPVQLTVLSVLHRFTARGTAEVGGVRCHVIEITAARVPDRVKDDTGGSPLWTLYVREDDGTLARYAWALHSYPCYVTGPVEQEGSRDCKSRLPVVPVVRQQVPLDVPLLSKVSSPPEFLFERDKKLDFVDELNRHKQTQVIGVVDDIVFGKRQRVVVVTLSGEQFGVRCQKWVAGYPWWLTWSRSGTGGSVESGLLRARLVKYGSAGEPGRPVPTPEWW